MKKIFFNSFIFIILVFFLSACCDKSCFQKKIVKPTPKPVVKVEKKATPKPAPVPKPQPKPAPKPMPKDDDHDGVLNKYDKCPNTLKGAPVDSEGCWHIGIVYFDFDKYNIKPEYFKVLDEIADVVKQNPSVKVEVMCHTDSKGNIKYNISLSKKRCESVRNYLIDKGVFPGKIIISYFGESKPTAPNDSSSHRALNRRAEFKIIR